MADKLKAFLRVVGHTILSFIAALIAGFTSYAFFRPGAPGSAIFWPNLGPE